MSHIERMKVELKDLKVKLNALRDFIDENPIYKTLKAEEQYLMIKQCEHMSTYAGCLVHRIELAS